MMRSLYLAAGLMVIFPEIATCASPEVAVLDPVMGNWEGEWSDEYSGSQGAIYARVCCRGTGVYGGVLEADVGGQLIPFPVHWKTESVDKPEFTGKFELGEERGGAASYKFSVVDGKLKGTVENDQVKVSMTLERVGKKPPTLGAKAPKGAVVLFDGRNLDAFEKVGGGPAGWTIVDGALQVKPGSGNIISKEKFGNQKLHIEFRTPYMPKMIDQARGNSGVYVTGKVEVQVLDTFGEDKPRDNGAGGIYSVAVPRVNACLPPGEWQTYDITYYLGKGDRPAEITVVYNGSLIHDKVKVKEATKGGIDGSVTEPGGLLLQDHGNLVEFRNIWVEPIPDQQAEQKDEKKADAK